MTTNEFDARPMPRDGDDPLAALVRAHAPAALADDGFTDRTMRAIARADPTPARPARASPIAIARALAHERRRYEAQARLWRWAMAGVAVGGVLLAVAVLLSPADVTMSVDLPSLPQWAPLWTLLSIGALWIAWREFRTA